MAKKSKNSEGGFVFSTNPNFSFEEDPIEETTILNKQQKLYVSIDKKQRAGKEVTLIEGFVGSEEDLKDLGKTLKTKCGVGGSVKDGDIIIQGNFRDKIMDILTKEGYPVKRKGS